MADKIIIEISGADQFSGTFAKLQTALGNASAHSGHTTSAFSKFQATIISVTSSLMLMQMTLGPIARGLFGIAETAGRFESMNIQLTRLTGSAKNAKEAFDWMVDFNRRTPLQLADVNDAFVKLTAIGINPMAGALQATSDAVAAFGGGTQNFNRAILAITQMAGKGVISMEELRRQLGEAIPTALPIMARELGYTRDKLGDFFALVESGGLEAKRGIDALMRGFQKEFSGASLAMMDTFEGKLSNLRDSWTLFQKALGEAGLLDAFKVTFDALTAILIDATHGFAAMEVGLTSWQLALARATEGMRNFWGLIDDGTEAVRRMEKQLIEAVERLNALNQGGKGAGKAVTPEADFVPNLQLTATLLTEVGDRVEDGVQSLTDFNIAIIQLIPLEAISNIDALADSIGGLGFKEFIDFIGSTKAELDALADSIGSLGFKEFINLADEVGASFDALADSIGPLREQWIWIPSMEDRQILKDVADEIDRVAKQSGSFWRGGTRTEEAKPGEAIAPDLGKTFVGIGNQLAGQLPGASGAIAGFQTGGPMGALAGFFAELFMRNEKMRAMIERLTEILVSLLDPIVESLAPSLDALAPALIELKPVFKLIGVMLKANLAPLTKALRALHGPLVTLGDVADKLTDIIKKLIKAVNSMGGGLIPGFATGGSLRANQLSIVGERGPELFVPQRAGTIVPNGGFGTTVNMYGRTDSEVVEMVRRMLMEMSLQGRLAG